jgi:hypothetical protein
MTSIRVCHRIILPNLSPTFDPVSCTDVNSEQAIHNVRIWPLTARYPASPRANQSVSSRAE